MTTRLRPAQRPQRTGHRCHTEWIVRPGRFESKAFIWLQPDGLVHPANRAGHSLPPVVGPQWREHAVQPRTDRDRGARACA
jgi:hypothetical protein